MTEGATRVRAVLRSTVYCAGMDAADLVALVEDVEHVMLAPGDAGVGDVGEVLAAARRTERVVAVLADGESAGDALAAYAERCGGTVEEARRVSILVVVGGPGAEGLMNVDTDTLAEVRRVAVADVGELAGALNARWDAQWCATRQFCC